MKIRGYKPCHIGVLYGLWGLMGAWGLLPWMEAPAWSADVFLSWRENAPEQKVHFYRVSERTGKGRSFVTDVTTNKVLLTNVSAGRHGYFISAWNEFGESPLGTEAGVSVSSKPVVPNPSILSRPALGIRYPVNRMRVAWDYVPVAGWAAARAGIDHVEVKINGGDWVNAQGAAGWLSETALLPGTNVVEARAVDADGVESDPQTSRVQYVVTSPLGLRVQGKGIVRGARPGQALEVGRNYVLSVRPWNGFVFTNWSGDVTSTAPVMTFMMQSNLQVTANLVDVRAPRLVVRGPRNGGRFYVPNGLGLIYGVALDNDRIASVWCRVNEGTWQLANGTAWWSALVPLVSGANRVEVYAEDPTGHRSWTNRVAFTISTGFPLTTVTNQTLLMASGTNTALLAGASTRHLSYAPDGTLGRLAWEGSTNSGFLLVYREFKDGTNRVAQVVSPEERWSLAQVTSYAHHTPAATLHYDTAGGVHVFAAHSAALHHYVRSGSVWALQEVIATTSAGYLDSRSLWSALGPGDAFHLLVADNNGLLHHVSNRSGSWDDQSAVGLVSPHEYPPWPQAPRPLGMAVDQNNAVHLAYAPFLLYLPTDVGEYFYSELHYATDQSGTWQSRLVLAPDPEGGDAGLGATIAIGPDNKPAILHSFIQRDSLGFPVAGQLLYHQLDSQGQWQGVLIADAADGYVEDGSPGGTGLAPSLVFDPTGRPHVVFTDMASVLDASGTSQIWEGQLRHAWMNGTDWSMRTMFRQLGAAREQLFYPTLAIHEDRIAWAGLRQFEWRPPRSRVNSVGYQLLLWEASLPGEADAVPR